MSACWRIYAVSGDRRGTSTEMARFTRTRPAPTVKGDYQDFRPFVRADFQQHCAYCLLPELHAGGENNFEMDHFRPKWRFEHLIRDFYNLYWACHVCNHKKRGKWPDSELEQRGIGFVDLCQDDFQAHYEVCEDGTWRPLTASAEYTIDSLRLNCPHLLELRRFLASIHNVQV